MKADCTRFRSELELALERGPAEVARLETQEHARTCPDCRRELIRERALERLLQLVPAPLVPPGLAGRVRTGLAAERTELAPGVVEVSDDVLEELLAGLPEPVVPAGLAGRVLAGLEAQRTPPVALPRRLPLLWLVAAGLLAALGGWAWMRSTTGGAAPEVVERRSLGPELPLEDDEELLAYAVERWELLQDEDLDLWLASLDPVDEILMEFTEDEAWLLDEAGGAEDRTGEGGF